MFNVIGLTLDQISSGLLPQMQLARTLDRRSTKSEYRFAPGPSILVYSTDGSDTQAMVARSKYKDQGQFILLLYFNDVAVAACKEMGIPIKVVDRIEDSELPARRVAVVDRPYLAPIPAAPPNATR